MPDSLSPPPPPAPAPAAAPAAAAPRAVRRIRADESAGAQFASAAANFADDNSGSTSAEGAAASSVPQGPLEPPTRQAQLLDFIGSQAQAGAPSLHFNPHELYRPEHPLWRDAHLCPDGVRAFFPEYTGPGADGVCRQPGLRPTMQARNSQQPWSPEEDALLRRSIEHNLASFEEVASTLNRSLISVKCRWHIVKREVGGK